MYAKRLDVYGFKAFGKARLDLQHPRRTGANLPRLRNVNLIMGDNGGGKSSVLRALAISLLAPVLLESGFVAYRMVRRGRPEERVYESAFLKTTGQADADEYQLRDDGKRLTKTIELIARFDMRSGRSIDRLHLEETPASPIADLLFDDFSPAFFVVGYGATRRVEAGDYSPSSARRSRGLRYQRVAGLFEDHVAMRPLQSWLDSLERKSPHRREEAIALLNAVLPPNIRFHGERDPEDGQFVFDFGGVQMPFNALSDGYKGFIGWVGDMIGNLADVTSSKVKLADQGGLVLVDEIDLHLHPSWQREVVPKLAAAFPRIQFVFTTHSPLVASTVERQNVFMTDTDEDGAATIKQLGESVFGRSAEQLLLSSYFGLDSTRPEAFQEESRELFRRAATGDAQAALTYLESLTKPAEDANEGGKR